MTADEITDRIRSVLVEAAVRAYEDAGVQGLCEEGRWEAAVSAMRSVDLRAILDRARHPVPAPES